jgi:cell division protein FtsQ
MARDKKKAAPAAPVRWRLWVGAMVLTALCASTAVAALKVRQFALSDSQFTFSREKKDALTIEGMKYASRGKVLRIFANDFEHSIFAVPLAERRRRLLAIDWVEDASLSRIWPDRLVVRVRERTPVAFVIFRSGVLLIDSRGVLLEPPAQAQFAFPVLSGVREEETEDDRRAHVRCLLRVQEEFGSSAKDISEVNAADPDNVRVMAQTDRGAVELIMGDNSFGRRYQNFISHYGEIMRRSPEAKKFDLRMDDRITAED